MAHERVGPPGKFNLRLRPDVVNSIQMAEMISRLIREHPEEWSRKVRWVVLPLHAAGQGSMALELQRRESLHQGDIPEGARNRYSTKFSGLHDATKAWEKAAGTSYEEQYAGAFEKLNQSRNNFVHLGPRDAVSIKPEILIDTLRTSADAILYIAFECSPIDWDEEQAQQIKQSIHAFKDNLSAIERQAENLQ